MIRKAGLQFGIPALLTFIAWNAYIAVSHLKQVQAIAALTLESSAIQAELSAVERDLTDMETGQRGYLLTGNSEYLQTYGDAKGRIESNFATLRAGLSNRTQRERSLELQLESLATSKLGEMERSISLRQQGYRHRSFKLVDTDEGKSYMDEIRRITNLLAVGESSVFARLDRDRNFVLKRAFSATISSNTALLVLAVFAFALTRRHQRLLVEEAAQSRTELAVRNSQLDKLTAALSGQARSKMVAINMNSQLLLENYGDFLPRQGHAYAEQMKEAAAEMERLRQDLVGNSSSNGEGRAA